MENNNINLQQGNEPEENGGFDFTLFLLECLSHWKWFLLSLIVVLGFAVYYTMKSVPIYNVKALVLMVDKWSKSESDVLTQSLGITSGVDNIFNEIEVMRSRTIVKKVVDDLDLYASYSMKGKVRNQPLYNNTPFVVRPDSTTNIGQMQTSLNFTIKPATADGTYNIEVKYVFEKERKEVEFATKEFPFTAYIPAVGTFVIEHVMGYDSIQNELYVTLRNPNSVAKSIASGLKISQFDKNTLLLDISYNTPIEQMGIDIINRVVYYYNEDGIAEKNRAANNTEAFINKRLVAIQKELSTVEEEVEQYRTQRGLTDISSEAQLYLQQTGEADKERSELDVQLSLVEYVETFLGESENIFAPIPALGITDDGLRSVIGDYNKAIAAREKLLSTSSENNPVVQEYTQNIRALRSNVLQGVASTRRGIELRKKDIQRQDSEIEEKIRNVPQYERELTDIMRQQRIKENLFVFLLEKREENALTQTLAVGDARMVDEPTSDGIVAPQKMKIFFGAFIIALLIPACIIFLKRLMFPAFQDKVELERLTNIPVLAELPHNGSNDFFVVREKSNDAIAELFRLLRNNLQFCFSSPEKKVVLVTSSVSKEGKTFVSSNLAVSFALTGKKVILVGLDIRRPRIAYHFDLPNKKGVTNYLSGQITDIDELIQHSGKVDTLDILSGGSQPPQPQNGFRKTQKDKRVCRRGPPNEYIKKHTAPRFIG